MLHHKQVIYYLGKPNINYKTIEAALRTDFHLIPILDSVASRLPVNTTSEIICLIIDIDNFDNWEERLPHFYFSRNWRPPVVAVTNLKHVSEGQLPLVTDLFKFVNIMHVKSQLKIMHNKLHWYKDQLTHTQQQSAEVGVVVSRKVLIEKKLREALLRDQVYLAYHPLVNIRQSDFDSFEVLFKWKGAPVNDITSDEIIEAANNIGVLDELTNWLIQRVAAFQNNLKAETGRYFNFMIDLSVNQILSERFFDALRDILDQYQVPPECFSFQIKADIINKPTFQIKRLARRVNELGVKVSIDCLNERDVSLARMTALPISHVRLDQLNLNNDFEILSRMAHDMGMKVIGREVTSNENQSAFLSKQVDYAQNLYLHQSFENSMIFFSKLATQ